MGVGPLWSLRGGAPAPEVKAAAEALLAPAAAASLPEAAVAESSVAVESAGAASAGAASAAASTAWFDDAPLPPPAAPVSDAAIARMGWAELRAAAARCTRCDLCRGRKNAVFGRGAEDAAWLLIGSAPSRADEKEGRPFSGAAGTLLENMLQAAGLAPARDAYLTNLVKCRPQEGAGADRAPSAQEVAACRPYLERELVLTQGKIIVTLGQPALKGLLGNGGRGTVHRFGATPVVASYHPAALLDQGGDKAKAWADLCLARSTHAGLA